MSRGRLILALQSGGASGWGGTQVLQNASSTTAVDTTGNLYNVPIILDTLPFLQDPGKTARDHLPLAHVGKHIWYHVRPGGGPSGDTFERTSMHATIQSRQSSSHVLIGGLGGLGGSVWADAARMRHATSTTTSNLHRNRRRVSIVALRRGIAHACGNEYNFKTAQICTCDK
jgi:hypothetical protein